MIPYVYLIGWKELDTWYGGSEYKEKAHPDNLWKTYFTSSKHVKAFRLEHGEPDHFEIIKEFPDDPSGAIEYEKQYLIENDAIKKPNWLNRNIGGILWGKYGPLSEEHKLKISKGCTGPSDETRRKIGIASKNRKRKPHSEETRIKISKSKEGKPLSEEHKAKMSELMKGERNAFYGKTHSEETRKKWSVIRKGRPLTEETRRKMSEAHKGKVFSEETRRKLSEAAKSRKLNSK